MDCNISLHTAIAANDTANLYRLLHHPNVDINYKNDEGKTPLIASIKNDFGSYMAMSLIRAGCDVNCKGGCGSTPLHEAIINNLIDVAHELVLRGANINARDKDNDTPLCNAIRYRNLEVVSLLLYHQADVNIPVGHGSHLILALDVNRCSDNDDIFKVLLDYCADFSCRDRYGNTALKIATRYNHSLAFDLLKRGATVNSIKDCEHTLLYFSTLWNNNELFKVVWYQLDHEILYRDKSFMLRYINESERCRFSNSEWLECFYLILNSPVAATFIKRYEDYVRGNFYFGILWYIMKELDRRDIDVKDKILIIHICLSLGAEIKADDLQFIHLLFGSNDVLEAVVCTGDLSYMDCKQQMNILFKEPFTSSVPVVMYRKFVASNDGKLRGKALCSAGFFSMSSEKKKRYLTWIKRNIPEMYNVIVEELDKIPQFPSLLEMSRGEAQNIIKEKFKVVKAYQFYDVVKSLKLPPLIEDIIFFKQPIY